MPSSVPHPNQAHVIASYNMSWVSGAGLVGDKVPTWASEAIFLKRATEPYQFWDKAYDNLMKFITDKNPSAIGLQEMVKGYGVEKIQDTPYIKENYNVSIGCIPIAGGGGEACLVTLTHKRLGKVLATYIKNLSPPEKKDARPILIVYTLGGYILVNLHAPHDTEDTVRKAIKFHFSVFLQTNNIVNDTTDEKDIEKRDEWVEYDPNKVYVMGDFNMIHSEITDEKGLQLQNDLTVIPGTNLPVNSCCHDSEDSKLSNYNMTGDYCLGLNVATPLMIVPSETDEDGKSVASDHELVWASFYYTPIKAAPDPLPDSGPVPLSALVPKNLKFKSVAIAGNHVYGIQNSSYKPFYSGENQLLAPPPEYANQLLDISPSEESVVVIDANGMLGGWAKKQSSLGLPKVEVKRIATGSWVTLAIKLDGTVVAFGTDLAHQVSGLPPDLKAKAIASKYGASYAIKEDNTVVGWGDNFMAVPEGIKAKIIAVSKNVVIATDLDDKLFGWGGPSPLLSALPTAISATSISLSDDHGLFITSNGYVGAWGNNTLGQTDVPFGLKGKSISAGKGCSFAVTETGEIIGWGKRPSYGDPNWITAFYENGILLNPPTPGIPPALGIPSAPGIPSVVDRYGVKSPAAVEFNVKKIVNVYDKYIPKDVPKGFEVRPVPYRDEILPAYVTTLPKGTLLFRGVTSTGTMAEDMGGLFKRDSKTYCCNPNFAPYFYPFPFFDEVIGNIYSHFIIYVLVTDVKVLCCIAPAPFSFIDKAVGAGFTSCAAIRASLCQELPRTYDTCLTDEFKQANTDVVGIMGFSTIDKPYLMEAAEGKLKQYKNYFNTYLDSRSLIPSIPEIAMFPFRSTLAAPFVHEIPDVKEYISKFVYVLNYVPLYTEERNRENIQKAIDALMSPKGLNGKKAKVNKETGFYQLINFSGVPFPEADSPRFTDPAFRFVRPAPGLAGGNRRTFRRRNRINNTRKHIV